MRRPVLCSNTSEHQQQGSSGAENARSTEQPQHQNEGALSKVRRLLSSSLPGSGGRKINNALRIFNIRLEDITSDKQRDGVPYILIRLCTHIEKCIEKQDNNYDIEKAFHSITSDNNKLLDKLRLSFDRNGDADLESTADIITSINLLKLWLNELPEQVISDSICNDMIQSLSVSRGDGLPELRKLIQSMPEINKNIIRYIGLFIRRLPCQNSQIRSSIAILIGTTLFRHRGQQQNACNQLSVKLVTELNILFATENEGMQQDQSIEEIQQQHVTAAAPSARKRKERHESAGSSQLIQDCKVIRSNSQERPETPMNSETLDSISEADKTLPLHEHNTTDSTPMIEDDEESAEHERRRSSERFASYHRNSAASRSTERANRRFHQPRKQRRESKENQDQYQNRPTVNDDETPHSFLQLHPQEERDRSPSPATPRQAAPLLDLSTLYQQVDCNEPVLSSSYAPHHRVPEESHVLLSPRNSMILTRRLDPNVAPSPPVEHVSSTARERREEESKTKQLSRQINNLKKKIKLYEEQYENQNGFRLSHADKLANRELKKMFTELNRLRKDLKQLKEDNVVTPAEIMRTPPDEEKNLSLSVREVERRLQEKRDEANRPLELENLTREQLQEEKTALQKALLHLESVHGRPSSRNDRDLVRPLYDRYRTLKRLVVRSGGSKLRDSMSELATILEHEAMEFTTSPESAQSSSAIGQDNKTESVEAYPHIGENLHALPMGELMQRQQEARDEKKRLRRLLREFEDQFQRDTGRKLQREDREPKSQDYANYKAAKARLRLLDALLAKRGATSSCKTADHHDPRSY